MNEQDKCDDDDERLLHEWGARMDMETKSYQERAQRRGLPVSTETWIGSSAKDYAYLEKRV